MKKEIRINITNIEDMETLGYYGLITEFFTILIDEIETGNKIVMERRYTNANPEIILKISSEEELIKFFKQFEL